MVSRKYSKSMVLINGQLHSQCSLESAVWINGTRVEIFGVYAELIDKNICVLMLKGCYAKSRAFHHVTVLSLIKTCLIFESSLVTILSAAMTVSAMLLLFTPGSSHSPTQLGNAFLTFRTLAKFISPLHNTSS